MVKLTIGKYYRNRGGDVVKITSPINEGESRYDVGFRFWDQNQNSYKENGSWSFIDKKKTDKDLIEEVETGGI